MTKEQKTIKLLQQQVDELTTKLKSCQETKDMYEKNYREADKELQDIHATLDILDVPAYSKENSYSKLKVTSRITLLLAKLNNIPLYSKDDK